MKTKLILSLAIAATLYTALLKNNVAYAIISEPTIQARKEIRMENREDAKKNMGEIKEEIQERKQERRSDIAEVHGKRLQHRFQVYYNRLNSMAKKIQNRFTTMSGEGKNVASAEAKVVEALAQIEEAKKYGDSSVAKFDSIDPETYEAQRQIALEAKDMAQEARDSFKLALSLLKEAVALAKEAN